MNYNAYKKNGKLLIAVILLIISVSTSVPLLLVFVNSWIYSYKISEAHPENTLTMDDCLFLIQYHNIVGCFLAGVLALLVGRYTDRVEPRVSLGLTYSCGFLILLAMFFTVPGHWFYYVSSAFFHTAHHTKMVAIRAYTQRMFPIEIRSTLLGNIAFGIALG